ncbi:MAG: hypothetical protein KKF12_18525 [Proteobacteria bacterium]|nr:hypothetical protein [Desulfobacula sp.]MBU3952964.1 hypothetical protein [Pseudomonadota bacterium]MBU4132817.1 hypothetical protein [Pseudomonadota bacterium]
MTKHEKTQIKTIMWRLLRSRKVVTYEDLQELAGASRSYAQEWMATLIKREVVRKLSKGRYQLINDAAPEIPPKELPGEKATRLKMVPGRGGLTLQKIDAQPESKLWEAIVKLKQFYLSDLIDLNITGKTPTSQYVALLARSGFLKKERLEGKNNLCHFTVARITGDAAPVIGRARFLYDPNTNNIWDDIPEGRKIRKQLPKQRKGLEDAPTS